MGDGAGMSKLAEALASHPDKKTLQIGGEQKDFLAGAYGFRLAKKNGVEVDFGGLERNDPVAIVDYLYAGLLPFDPDLDYDLFSVMLSEKEMARLAEVVQEDGEEGEGESAGN